MSAPSPFAWYRAALAGEKPPIHANEPQCGYFRTTHDGGSVAAMIWPGDNGLEARIGAVTVDPHRVWMRLAKNPIPEGQARYWFEHGRWPHEATPDAATTPEPSNNEAMAPASDPGPRDAVIGDNSGAAPGDTIFDELLRKATIEVEHATDWLTRTKIATQEQADIAGDKIDALRKLWKRADDARAEEKQPHLDAERAVDNKWRAMLKALKDASDTLKRAAEAWKDAEDARRKKEAEEAEAQRQAAIAEAEASGKEAPELPAPPPAPEPVRIGGTSGRRIGFRTDESIVVTDVSKAYRLKAVREHPDVRAAIEAVCNALFKFTGKVPAGCEKRTSTRAA